MPLKTNEPPTFRGWKLIADGWLCGCGKVTLLMLTPEGGVAVPPLKCGECSEDKVFFIPPLRMGKKRGPASTRVEED